MMFFRRKKKPNDKLSQPAMDKDGNLYVEEGQDYDEDQYETDSDYEDSDESDESDESEDGGDKGDGEDSVDSEEEEENGQDDNLAEEEGEEETLKLADIKSEDVEAYDEDEELIPWDNSTQSEDDDNYNYNGNDDNVHKEDDERTKQQMREEEKKDEDTRQVIHHSLGINESNSKIVNNTSNHDDHEVHQHHQQQTTTSMPTMNGETTIEDDNQDDNLNIDETVADVDDDGDDDDDDDEKVSLIPKYEMNQSTKEKVNDEDIPKQKEKRDQQEQEQPQTSLHEKKSLLALAAQHDRVDIIKTILQSTHPQHTTNNNYNTSNDLGSVNGTHQLIQLLLNNKLVDRDTNNNSNSTMFTEDDIDQVFLPPLHIAIASSSTNAASCLLRMGSDPSIRTIIPKNWDGPTWEDDGANKNDLKKKQEMTQYWSKLSGLSAWEVAFGSSSSSSSSPPSMAMNNKDEDGSTNGGSNNKEQKRSWFGGWSSNNNTTSNNVSFDISPSKLEGIKHAFTAEALRAIGSDEVHRLRELLNSGLDAPPSQDRNNHGGSGMSNTNGSGGSSNSSRGVEIGGKDLLSWCVEMNAEKCSTLLKETYSNSSTAKEKNESKPKTNIEKEEKSKDIGTIQNDRLTQEVGSSAGAAGAATIDDIEISEDNLLTLKIKLEENKVLAGSLSLVLDNLAEEVSLTQGLLYQGDSSNTALISQVRTLKENRADAEMEISEWEGRLADRIVELRLVLTWWKNKGGSENDFIEIFDSTASNGDALATQMISIPPTPRGTNNAYDDQQSLRSKIMEMIAQVSLIEGKVKKLRSSIADLAEENSRNLIEVTKMGLGGAVNLARKLKEEVKEREHILQNLQQREAACRTRVCMIRNQLEKASTEVTIANEAPATEEDTEEVNEVVATADIQNSDLAVDGDIGSRIEEAGTNETPEEDVIYYDEEEDCIIEYVDNSDGSDVEYEYYTDEEEEGVADNVPRSEAIKTGKSTKIMLKEEQHQFLSFKLWELLLRVIGLSKQAVKETVQSSGFEDITKLSGAMIV